MKLYLPFSRNTITQGFAANANPFYAGIGLKGHPSIDWGVMCGNKLYNCAKGYCYSVRNKDAANLAQYRSVYLICESDKGVFEVSYGHLDQIYAEVGKTYEVGEVLGTTGNTGDVYQGGVKVTKYRPGCPGGHLHGPQVRVLKKTKTRSSSKKYLTTADGYYKKDGYYYEIPNYNNGYNGCVDPENFFVETLAKDYNRPVKPFVFQPGATGYPVKVFQSILQDTGFFPKTTKVTEFWGPITTQSYEKFKAATGFLIVPSSSSTGGEEVLPSEGMNDSKPKFAFLSSPRFWQLAIVGIATGLTMYESTGSWINAFNTAVGIWFGGSVLVGTYDRGQDKKVEAATLSQEG